MRVQYICKCISTFLLLCSLSSNIELAENVDVYVVQKETCEEARTSEVNKLDNHRYSTVMAICYVYLFSKESLLKRL